MSALFDVPRQYIMDLANEGTLHFTFSYAFVVNGFLCALVIGPRTRRAFLRSPATPVGDETQTWRHP